MGDWGRGYDSDDSDGGGRWGGYGWGNDKDNSSRSSDERRDRYWGRRSSSNSSSSHKDAYATYTKDDGVSLKNEGGWGDFDDDDRRSDRSRRSSGAGSSGGRTFDIFKHSLEWNDGEVEFKDEEANFSVDSDLKDQEEENEWRIGGGGGGFRHHRRRRSSSDSRRRDRRRRSSSSSSSEARDKRSDREWRKSRHEQYYPDVVKMNSDKISWCCCVVL